MTKKNGGPAFPQSGVCTPEIESWDSNDFGGRGLSMRDYFAAKAMATLCASCSHEEAVAVKAYRYADEMLKAREI